MQSPPTPRIVIINRTAFPLNIGLIHLAPLRHINALEPGASLVTPASPIPHDCLPRGASLFRLLTAIPHVPFIHCRLRCTCLNMTTIEVRFDHGHNRFSSTAAASIWTRTVVEMTTLFFAMLTACSALALVLYRAVYEQLNARFRHLELQNRGPILRVGGFRLPMHDSAGNNILWKIGVLPLCGLSLILILLTRLLAPKSSHTSKQTTLPSQAPLLSVPVPTHTLQPSSLSRSDRHFMVCWEQGRVLLWDADRNCEIVSTRRHRS